MPATDLHLGMIDILPTMAELVTQATKEVTPIPVEVPRRKNLREDQRLRQ